MKIKNIILGVLLIRFAFVNAQYIRPIFPKDGQMVFSDTVHFHWNRYLTATTYHLQVATDTAFTRLLVNADVSGTDTIIRGFWQDTTFYWRLQPQGGTYGPCLSFIYFTPRMIPSLVGWYSADSCHLVNDYIDTLYDKSMNNLHLIQSNINNRPSKIASDSLLNDKATLYFDGNDYLITYRDTICNQANTYISLVQSNTINKYTLFCGKNNNNRNQFGYDPTLTAFYYYAGALNNSDTNILKINQFGYSNINVCFNQSNSTTHFNNKKIFDSNVGNLKMQGLVLGTKATLNGEFFIGCVPEFIYYHTILDSSAYNILLHYISEKYYGRLNLGEDVASTSLCPITLKLDKEYVSYLWSTGDTTPFITISKNGIYWLTTINRFGWKETDTIDVFLNVPNLTDTLICKGDTVKWNLNYNYPYTYQWSNGLTGQEFVTDKSGKYSVILTDSIQRKIGLFFKVSTTDTIQKLTSISLVDSLCNGNTINLVYPRTTKDYNIIWTTGDTCSITTTFDQTGWYGVQVQDKYGCVGKDSIYIIKKGNAPLTAFTATNSCMGDSTAFTNTSTTNDGTHITLSEWYLGDGETRTPVNAMDSFKHLYDTPGLYIVTLHCVTDAGCEQEYRQSVSVYSYPQPDFTPVVACQNSPVTFANLTRSEYRVGDYTWHFTPQDSSALAIPEFTFTDTGTYTVQLVATNVMGCTDSIAHTLYVKPNPQALFTHNTPCVGNTLYLNDITNLPVEQKAVNRTWSVNGVQLEGTANHAQLPINKDGNYHALLHMQYLNGCHSMAEADIWVNPLPIADFTVSPVCQYDTIPISTTAMADMNYEWHYMGHTYCGTAPAIPADSTGRHTLMLYVYDANRCADSTLQNVMVHPSPKADFTYDYAPQGLYTIQFENHSQSADTYTWQFDNMGMSAEEHPAFDFPAAGTYMVCLTAANGGACTHEQKQQLVLPEHHVEVALMDFRLMEQNGTIRPQVLLLNRSNRAIPLLQYTFTYNNERIYETDSISLPAGEMRQYSFRTAISAKQQADYACITLATPYDSYQVADADREKCLLLHSGNFVHAPYPNPTGGKVNVCYGINDNTDIVWQIYNSFGQLIYQLKDTKTSGIYTQNIDISNYAQGNYILKVNIGNEVYSYKLKKE